MKCIFFYVRQRICWCTPCCVVTGTSQLKIMRKLRSLHQVHSKRLHNDTHVSCSLQSPHTKGLGMITSIWNLPREPFRFSTRTVTPLLLNLKCSWECMARYLVCICSTKENSSKRSEVLKSLWLSMLSECRSSNQMNWAELTSNNKTLLISWLFPNNVFC